MLENSHEAIRPEVFPFNPSKPEKLISTIINCNKKVTKEKIKSERIFKYILKYFNYEFFDKKENLLDNCKAYTCVLEQKYVSQSYLTDYSHYYTTSFSEISKFTSRIHFFHSKFNEEEFDEYAILNKDSKNYKGQQIWESYLGYMTIRPLGGSPFGTILFKTYPYIENFRSRYYNSILEDFRFDVFGEQIRISSLPFQQQDKAVGACATFAIWCCYHKLQQLYKTKLLSPYEITKKAGISQIHSESMFPTVGLDGYQVVSIFEESNLRTETFSFEDKQLNPSLLKEIIYAYNKCGIPILLGYEFDDASDNYDGHHIVAIVGYRLNQPSVNTNTNSLKKICSKLIKTKEKKKEIGLVAHDIMRFYTHNDELGPYSKVDFDMQNNNTCKIRTFQLDGESPIIARPTALWIPLDHTIKVKYENVLAAIKSFDKFLLKFMTDTDFLKWDIRLCLAVDYKQEFSNSDSSDNIFMNNLKRKIRYTSFPKYIWIATLTEVDENNDEYPSIDVIYDASSLPNENCIFQINCFNEELHRNIKNNSNLSEETDKNPNVKNYPNYV
ncbi:hypothetical protein Q4Q34_08645 [Flavivirga abyssicola]|uniref:hypothetical protein n=1 Tax=Flavivirga abyssicola TaxID=3063533 RepID=UPI0026DF9973|nr:hypothetical protein [Flavivirga sp. MEBiC07777]WVK15095.1 hypothetical protein Q4Q34_08645 [Flavivirga sp. MEBiC07777]